MDIISPDLWGEWQAAIEAAQKAALPGSVAAPDPILPRAKANPVELMTVRYPSGFT